MADRSYHKASTALLLIDPYNDFISEGGKIWGRVRAVAEATITIEMAEEAGEENFFLFGLTADEVAGSRGWYDPDWHYEHEPEVRSAVDLTFSSHFSSGEPNVFAPLREAILTHGDHYMHLAHLTSYLDADGHLRALYDDSDGWTRKVIANVAGSGKFSSDRTIAEYANDIWHVQPCPVV